MGMPLTLRHTSPGIQAITSLPPKEALMMPTGMFRLSIKCVAKKYDTTLKELIVALEHSCQTMPQESLGVPLSLAGTLTKRNLPA